MCNQRKSGIHEKLPSVRRLNSPAIINSFASRISDYFQDQRLAFRQQIGISRICRTVMRRVFIKNPAPEFKLKLNEFFELRWPLYRLCDTSDLWHHTLHNHLTDELRMIPTNSDPSSYFSFRNGELVELNGSYVEDHIRAGDTQFREECSATHRRLEATGDESPSFTFAGFNIRKLADALYEIDQTFYLKKLEDIHYTSTTFSDFRSMRIYLT